MPRSVSQARAASEKGVGNRAVVDTLEEAKEPALLVVPLVVRPVDDGCDAAGKLAVAISQKV